MMRFFLLGLFVSVLSFASFHTLAETEGDASEAAVVSEEGAAAGEEQAREPGPVDVEAAKEIALELVPGDVSQVRKVNEDEKSVFEFRIKKDDRSVVEVDVNAETGEAEIFYRDIRSEEHLPEPEVDIKEARETAKEYVDGKVKGKRKPRVLSAKHDVYEAKPAYVFKVKKLMTEYNVYIDPETGTIISAETYD